MITTVVVPLTSPPSASRAFQLGHDFLQERDVFLYIHLILASEKTQTDAGQEGLEPQPPVGDRCLPIDYWPVNP